MLEEKKLLKGNAAFLPENVDGEFAFTFHLDKKGSDGEDIPLDLCGKRDILKKMTNCEATEMVADTLCAHCTSYKNCVATGMGSKEAHKGS